MYRTATGNVLGIEMFSDDDVIHEYNLLCPMTFLRLARLQLFCRCVRKDSMNLLTLMKYVCDARGGPSPGAVHTWARSVLVDLNWFAASDEFKVFQGTTLTHACAVVAADPG
eukprot:1527271-Karenia_brevis.AAC.1